MKQAADLESVRDAALSRESVTGVREATGTQEVDSPTEEIDLLETGDLDGPAAVLSPPDPARPRKTSVPPPPPAEALRVRPSSAPSTTPSVPPPSSVYRARLPSPLPAGLGVRAPLLPKAPQLSAAAPEIERLKEELERVTKRMRERDAYLAELEAVYAQRESALLKAEQQIDQLQRQLAEQTERVDELERAKRPLSAPPSAADDDLTRIRGIGPRYARQLKEVGVRSFAAIAAWTPGDILTISRELKVTPSRIERDEWIEQARVLVKLLNPRAGG